MIILKNAFVFSFNREHDLGRHSLLINDGKITDIADSSPKGESKLANWIALHQETADIIDCSSKIIMPPFVNSCVKSEGSLIHYLLKRRHYEKVKEDLTTDLIFNYLYRELPGDDACSDLTNLYNYSYTKLLKSGVTSFNEFSLRRDINHLQPITNALKLTGQKVSVCYPIKQDSGTIRDYKFVNPSYYLTQENQLTVYDISNITELRNHGVRDLFLEVAVNKEVTENFKLTFHKSVVAVLDEYGLIDENTSLINPLYMDYNDFKIITDRKANVIICPRDLNHFSNKYFPVDDYIGHGIKFSIGTGWLGEDLLKDVRLFRNKYRELNISSIDLLLAVTRNPLQIFFNNDFSGGGCLIDVNKPADLIMIDLADSRLQFFAQDSDFESVCDFIIDYVTGFNISDVIINGVFKVKNNKPVDCNEFEILKLVNETRSNLYRVGRYEELKKKSESHYKSKAHELSERNDDEIKLFSDTEDTGENIDSKEEFRIKTRIPVFRTKTVPGQRNLFEELEHSQIMQSDDFNETPLINLVNADELPEKQVEDDIIQSKTIDDTIIKKIGAEKKKDKSNLSNNESKIELPKNVKLKFGDD